MIELRFRFNEVLSVLNITSGRSVDLMNILEQTYGKNVTTRNWNTILRVVSSAA